MSIQKLNIDCLANIAQHTDRVNDLRSFRLVSRAWRDAADTTVTSISFAGRTVTNCLELLRRWVPRTPNLESLVLNFEAYRRHPYPVTALDPDAMDEILQQCRLSSLALSYVDLDGEVSTVLARHCAPSVVRLRLRHCILGYGSMAGLSTATWSKVREVSFDDYDLFDDNLFQSVDALMSQFPNVTTLSMARRSSGKSFVRHALAAAESACPHLQVFRCANNDLSSSAPIGHYPDLFPVSRKIRMLDLRDCQLSPDLLRQLCKTQLPQLESIDVTRSSDDDILYWDVDDVLVLRRALEVKWPSVRWLGFDVSGTYVPLLLGGTTPFERLETIDNIDPSSWETMLALAAAATDGRLPAWRQIQLVVSMQENVQATRAVLTAPWPRVQTVDVDQASQFVALPLAIRTAFMDMFIEATTSFPALKALTLGGAGFIRTFRTVLASSHVPFWRLEHLEIRQTHETQGDVLRLCPELRPWLLPNVKTLAITGMAVSEDTMFALYDAPWKKLDALDIGVHGRLLRGGPRPVFPFV